MTIWKPSSEPGWTTKGSFHRPNAAMRCPEGSFHPLQDLSALEMDRGNEKEEAQDGVEEEEADLSLPSGRLIAVQTNSRQAQRALSSICLKRSRVARLTGCHKVQVLRLVVCKTSVIASHGFTRPVMSLGIKL